MPGVFRCYMSPGNLGLLLTSFNVCAVYVVRNIMYLCVLRPTTCRVRSRTSPLTFPSHVRILPSQRDVSKSRLHYLELRIRRSLRVCSSVSEFTDTSTLYFPTVLVAVVVPSSVLPFSIFLYFTVYIRRQYHLLGQPLLSVPLCTRCLCTDNVRLEQFPPSILISILTGYILTLP